LKYRTTVERDQPTTEILLLNSVINCFVEWILILTLSHSLLNYIFYMYITLKNVSSKLYRSQIDVYLMSYRRIKNAPMLLSNVGKSCIVHAEIIYCDLKHSGHFYYQLCISLELHYLATLVCVTFQNRYVNSYVLYIVQCCVSLFPLCH
jgi:hypothetical protein